MKVVELLSKRIQGEEDVNYNYIYRLLRTNFQLNSGDKTSEIQSYGIEAERQDICNGSIINIEREFIRNISPHRHKVQELLRLVYNNTVSPIHLIDVLGEHADSCVLDFDEDLVETVQSNY